MYLCTIGRSFDWTFDTRQGHPGVLLFAILFMNHTPLFLFLFFFIIQKRARAETAIETLLESDAEILTRNKSKLMFDNVWLEENEDFFIIVNDYQNYIE